MLADVANFGRHCRAGNLSPGTIKTYTDDRPKALAQFHTVAAQGHRGGYLPAPLGPRAWLELFAAGRGEVEGDALAP